MRLTKLHTDLKKSYVQKKANWFRLQGAPKMCYRSSVMFRYQLIKWKVPGFQICSPG